MKLTVRHNATLGWVVYKTHAISGLPQAVAYDKDKDTAIAKAKKELGVK